MTAQDRGLHHQADIELTERELNMVSGGDGPPSTAGDGNGRAMHRDAFFDSLSRANART
jgi:hypothetical protein